MDTKIDIFVIVSLGSVLIIGAIIDLCTQKIPNFLTFPAMVAGLVYHTVTSGWHGMIFSFSGLMVGTAIFLIPYMMGGMGAGDAKLMGAVGSIIGLKGIFYASLLTAITGGIYALVLFLLNIQFLKSFFSRHILTAKTFSHTGKFIPIPADNAEKRPKLCYGVAIAIGTLFYMLLTYHGYKFPI